MLNESPVCEEDVFKSLFTKHAETIRNFIYFKNGDADEASDIAQEAFIKLWQNCADVPLEKAKSFLYTVANNLFLNVVAHKKVKLNYAAEKPKGHTHENPEYVLEEKEYRQKLETAIANLSEAQRVAFLLNRIEGKKYSEIAEMLNISVKAVEKRIGGALQELRKTIVNI